MNTYIVTYHFCEQGQSATQEFISNILYEAFSPEAVIRVATERFVRCFPDDQLITVEAKKAIIETV